MKVLKLNKFNEKLAVNQISLSELDELPIEKRDKLNIPSITEYYVHSCDVRICEDNYNDGEIIGTEFSYDSDVKPVSDSLVGLLEEFVDQMCPGHKFDLEEFVYDPDKPNRIELSVMGKLVDEYVTFVEPTQKDWNDFRAEKTNLTSYTFDLRIGKREVVLDLRNEFEDVGLSEF